MNKTVYGVYESNAEVIQAINALKAKGFEGDDILVVADKEETLDFTNHQRETDVRTMTNVPNDESFMDKVARFFMPNDTADISTRLADAGLSNSEAAEHVYDVEHGKVLVLVEEGEGHLGTSRNKFTTGARGVGTSGTTLDTNSANPFYNGTEKTDALNKDDVYGVNGRGREDSLETGSINEGETLRIPVVDEKLEGSKIPVVTDEIVIKKHAVQETEQVQDTFKKEDVQLDSTDDTIVHEKKATERRKERF
ncbi:YsnF/AvaK domain-containing protein [Peribacillus butanolivorans]|uniref:YsnF/AvaK domain-containing protein n=1 Tax=Peribacillus butanolivorans TaxID=421767 RepID=UPI003D291465